MKGIKIIEKSSDATTFKDMPPSYRVSITVGSGTKHPITITR